MIKVYRVAETQLDDEESLRLIQVFSCKTLQLIHPLTHSITLLTHRITAFRFLSNIIKRGRTFII